MADVTPTSSGSAFWVAVLMQGTMARPRPRPSRSSLGSTWVTYEASGVKPGEQGGADSRQEEAGHDQKRVSTWSSGGSICVAASALSARQGKEGEARQERR